MSFTFLSRNLLQNVVSAQAEIHYYVPSAEMYEQMLKSTGAYFPVLLSTKTEIGARNLRIDAAIKRGADVD